MPYTFLGSYAGEWFEVTTPEQARLLSDAALRHLTPFVGRTLGAAQAAREAGVSTERMLYRMKAFLSAGLLTEVPPARRTGRLVRQYRAPGGFRLPFALTPFADLEAQILRAGRNHERLRARAAAQSLLRLSEPARLIYRDEQGQVHSETHLPGPHARDGVIGGDYVGVVWLRPDEARQLQHTLDALRTLGRAEPVPGSAPYLVQDVLLAVDPEDARRASAPPL